MLTLAALGCCGWLLWKDMKPSVAQVEGPRPEPVPVAPVRPVLYADEAQRVWHRLQSVDGTYEFPPEEQFGLLVMLKFEDSKCRGRLCEVMVPSSTAGTRTVAYQLVWGTAPDGSDRLAVVTKSDRGTSTQLSPKKEDGFFSRLGKESHTSIGGSDKVRDYRVLAMVSSAEVRAGKEAFANDFRNVEFMIDTRQVVAVVGIKTFATRKQLEDAYFTPEPIDP